VQRSISGHAVLSFGRVSERGKLQLEKWTEAEVQFHETVHTFGSCHAMK